MSDAEDFYEEDVGDLAQPVDEADILPQAQLSEAIHEAVKNAVAEASHAILPQQICGKRASISRGTSPSSGGADADVGSDDFDADTQEGSGCENHNRRSRGGRGGRPPTYVTSKEKKDARNHKKKGGSSSGTTGRAGGSPAALPPMPPRPPPAVP